VGMSPGGLGPENNCADCLYILADGNTRNKMRLINLSRNLYLINCNFMKIKEVVSNSVVLYNGNISRVL
jgi:hypothetical protein